MHSDSNVNDDQTVAGLAPFDLVVFMNKSQSNSEQISI